MSQEEKKLASAVINVKDRPDGTLDIDVVFSPDVQNDSLAHRLVQRFIEYINTPETQKGASAESPRIITPGS